MAMTIQAAARWLSDRDGYLILTHKRPDGDTLGCAAGLCLALRALGKTAWILPNADATSLFTPYLEGVSSKNSEEATSMASATSAPGL